MFKKCLKQRSWSLSLQVTSNSPKTFDLKVRYPPALANSRKALRSRMRKLFQTQFVVGNDHRDRSKARRIEYL